MPKIPETSTTLLRDLAQDSRHARWGEFVARYRPMMETYMHTRFPMVDADDAIQETLIALIKVFPVYHYSPEETGAFHNYLTGILRHRALRMIECESRRLDKELKYQEIEGLSASGGNKDDGLSWRESVFEIALQQLLADESINDWTKQVFVRVAVNGEKPESVAESFGITRNSVDQMKARMKDRLRELANALMKVEDEIG
ncbi:MAG: sigma-70 family RNA polymerase sigma factor [Kiritimatiellae bacterium]|nr:sigma-70 family RNA polymerase sigma factor [Kiritimatiellia bacterium]